MRCYHCGQELENGTAFCLYCGASQGAGATVVLDQAYNPYATESESGRTAPLPENQYNTVDNMACIPQPPVQPGVCALQLPTTRGLAKMIFLSIITLGIYGLVIWSRISTELNITASRYDGKRTMPYLGMTLLMPLTAGIYYYVWMHKLCARAGSEAERRGLGYKFGASDFWLWAILGSLLFGVGPLVFCHKLMKCMNLINSDFNCNG